MWKKLFWIIVSIILVSIFISLMVMFTSYLNSSTNYIGNILSFIILTIVIIGAIVGVKFVKEKINEEVEFMRGVIASLLLITSIVLIVFGNDLLFTVLLAITVFIVAMILIYLSIREYENKQLVKDINSKLVKSEYTNEQILDRQSHLNNISKSELKKINNNIETIESSYLQK